MTTAAPKNPIFEKARAAADHMRSIGYHVEVTVHPTGYGNSAYVTASLSKDNIRLAKCRAVSTNWVSFSVTKACRGVLVIARRTVHFSRVGASKICIAGGGADRFQYVYKLRR